MKICHKYVWMYLQHIQYWKDLSWSAKLQRLSVMMLWRSYPWGKKLGLLWCLDLYPLQVINSYFPVTNWNVVPSTVVLVLLLEPSLFAIVLILISAFNLIYHLPTNLLFTVGIFTSRQGLFALLLLGTVPSFLQAVSCFIVLIQCFLVGFPS